MILEFTKRQIEPGVTALIIKGSIHCGPECARLEKQVDELIGSSEYRVIFDMAGGTPMGNAGVRGPGRCPAKTKKTGRGPCPALGPTTRGFNPEPDKLG